MKLEVEFGPLRRVALVWADATTAWALGPGVVGEGQLRIERAPQMWNISWGDPNFEALEMDDEYPFPRVFEELGRRIEAAKK